MAGQPTISCGHERCRLFVARNHKLNLGAPQRLYNVQVFLARYPEDSFNPFVLQSFNEEIRSFHHWRTSWCGLIHLLSMSSRIEDIANSVENSSVGFARLPHLFARPLT